MKALLTLLASGLLAFTISAQESIYDIIKNDSCPGTEVIGEPQIYIGDDLFNLINGGAELYHEFGFVEVLAAEMAVPGGDPLKVEVYDMGSPGSAWGIYSMTATAVSRPFHAGTEGRHGEGYSQFVKGNYMVYFHYDFIEETELQYVAGCISQNIHEFAPKPGLMKAVEAAMGDPEKLIYFKGNLGLSSMYNFHYKDVFAYSAGAGAVYPDLKIFLLNYDDEVSCIGHYNEARDFFMESPKYHDQFSLRGSFHMKDRKEQQIDCYLENTYLIMFVSSGDLELDGLREKIVQYMDKL